MSAADAQTNAPTAPIPIGPRDATVTNGRAVTFAWEPSPEADRYRLQIAKTSNFEDLVVDEDVGDETAVTVGNQLPTDGDTFFWRVVAGSADDWGRASSVESFIASTEEEAEQELLQEEDVGPVAGLARADKSTTPEAVLDIQDRIEKEKERGVAYEGIAATQIMAIAVAILVVILVAVVVLFAWYGQVAQETRASASDAQNYELRQQTETEAAGALTRYGVVDEENDVYQIPIDRAMDVIAREEYQRSASEGPRSAPSQEDGQ